MAENNEIRNDELLEAIDAMRKDFNAETQNKVINIAIRATYYVPAIVDQNTQLVADKNNHLSFQNRPQARFMLVKHPKNGSFFPVFTDMESFNTIERKENFQAVKMKFADVATLTEQSAAKVAGFVINPMTTNLPFPQQMLASIKKTLAEARAKRAEASAASSPENQPNITVSGSEEN